MVHIVASQGDTSAAGSRRRAIELSSHTHRSLHEERIPLGAVCAGVDGRGTLFRGSSQ